MFGSLWKTYELAAHELRRLQSHQGDLEYALVYIFGQEVGMKGTCGRPRVTTVKYHLYTSRVSKASLQVG